MQLHIISLKYCKKEYLKQKVSGHLNLAVIYSSHYYFVHSARSAIQPDGVGEERKAGDDILGATSKRKLLGLPVASAVVQRRPEPVDERPGQGRRALHPS